MLSASIQPSVLEGFFSLSPFSKTSHPWKMTAAKITFFTPYVSDYISTKKIRLTDKPHCQENRSPLRSYDFPMKYAVMMKKLQSPEVFRQCFSALPPAYLTQASVQNPSNFQEMYEQDPEFAVRFLRVIYEKNVEWWPREEAAPLVEKVLYRCLDSTQSLKKFIEQNPKAHRLKALLDYNPSTKELIEKNPDVSPHFIEKFPRLLFIKADEHGSEREALSRALERDLDLNQLVLSKNENDQIIVDPTHPQNAFLYFVQYPSFDELIERRVWNFDETNGPEPFFSEEITLETFSELNF